MDNTEIASLVINLIITAFIYMIVPVIIIITKKEMTENRAKKIAFLNSLCGFVVFIILFIILKRDINIITGSPAIIYWWINYKLLSRNIKKEEKHSYYNEEQEEENLKQLIKNLENENK